MNKTSYEKVFCSMIKTNTDSILSEDFKILVLGKNLKNYDFLLFLDHIINSNHYIIILQNSFVL